MSFFARLLDAIGIDMNDCSPEEMDVDTWAREGERLNAIAPVGPTLDNAVACMSCRSIQTPPAMHLCSICGSDHLTDISRDLTRTVEVIVCASIKRKQEEEAALLAMARQAAGEVLYWPAKLRITFGEEAIPVTPFIKKVKP